MQTTSTSIPTRSDVSCFRTRHRLTGLGLCLVMLLSACSGSGSGGNSFTPPGAPEDAGACRYVLEDDITSPTRLINTDANCDYLLDGWVEVSSLLQIEPGVVVRATADARLVIEGGELSAIGTAQQRIVMEGLSHVSGFWRGINVNSARNVAFDFFDMRDGGQVCSILFCPDVGLMVDNTRLSFTHSSVSNSYVIGMSITGDVEIDAFANNRFFGNSLHGLAVDGNNIPGLDENSDYRGIGDENGIVGVGVHSGDQTRGEIFQWKKINAPYLINGYYNVSGGTLLLDPGVELAFDEGAWFVVEGNGVFKALGTAAEPIIIRGQQARPGYWDGIRFEESPWDSNILEHVVLSHSGNTEGLLSAYAAINLDESHVSVSNTTFKDNSRWAIVCNEPDYPYEPSVITDGGGNTFSNNESGDIDSDCTVR